MLQEFWEGLRWALGLDVARLTLWQMAARGLIVYLAALAMVRLGGGRLIGKHAAFDVVLGIIFGSVLSRTVNGSVPFFETLEAGVVLISLHWLFAVVAFRSHRFGKLVKGHTQTLIQGGELQWDQMSKSLSANAISWRPSPHSLRPRPRHPGAAQPAGSSLPSYDREPG